MSTILISRAPLPLQFSSTGDLRCTSVGSFKRVSREVIALLPPTIDQLLADRTAERSMIGYWHDAVVCLSVCHA